MQEKTGLDTVEERSELESQYSSNASKGPPREYEELVQKLEGDVRNHI